LTERPARKASTTRCSLTSRRTRQKRKPITPAAAWTPKENQKALTIARREVRLEDPELHIPNKLKSKFQAGELERNSKLQTSKRAARFPISYSVMLSKTKHPAPVICLGAYF
jgi:hypothetical protein